MEPLSNHPHDASDLRPSDDAVERAARELAKKFELDSAFVKVGALSRILGLAAPTIYAAIKAGRFPIPHRKVGATPLVKLEDLARWYCANEAPTANAKPKPNTEAVKPRIADAAAKAKLVASVLREMRVED
jgi:hypothetical protein